MEDCPANLVDPVDDQSDRSISADGPVSDQLVVEEAGQLVETGELVITAVIVKEVVGLNLLAPLVLQMRELENQFAVWPEVVFSCNVALPIIYLFHGNEAPHVIPLDVEELAKVVKVLQVDDVLLGVIAASDIENPVAVT